MKLFFYLFFLCLLIGKPSFTQDSAWYSVPLPKNSTFIDIISDNSGCLFISTTDGLYSTTDNCKTFTQHFKTDSTHNSLYDIVITKNNNIIGVSRGLSYYVYITSDLGINWKKIPAPELIFNLKTDTSGNIWATSYNGFYKSTDNGFNWKKVDSPVKDLNQLYITKDNDFYGVLNSALYKSTDGGSNWFNIYSEGGVASLGFNDEGNIFLSAWGQGFLMSTDKGRTWTKRGELINSAEMAFDKSGMIYYANNIYSGVYKSADTARTWNYTGGGRITMNKLRIYNGILYAGGSYRLYKYNKNYVPPVMPEIIYPLNKNNVWLYKKDTYWSNQGSSSDEYSLDTVFVEKDTLINGKNYYCFSNAKQDWLRYSESDNKVYLYQNNQESVFLDFTLSVQYPFSKLLLNNHQPWDAWVDSAGRQNFLGLEEDYFNLLGPNGDRGSRREQYHSNLGLTNLDLGYYSMGSGSSGERSTLIQARIDNGGMTKEYSMPYYPEISITPPDTLTSPELRFNFKVGHKLSSIFSSENCLNFIDSVYLLGYYKKGDSITMPVIFEASNILGTITYSVNTLLDLDLLQNGYSFNFKVIAKDKGIIKRISSAPDTGFYSVKYCTDPLSIKKQDSEALSFNLGQNYPNPANPSTVIIYSVPEECRVRLILYNTLGQVTKIVEDSQKQAGNYKKELDCRGLSSGIYFYTLSAGNYYKTKKLIIAK